MKLSPSSPDFQENLTKKLVANGYDKGWVLDEIQNWSTFIRPNQTKENSGLIISRRCRQSLFNRTVSLYNSEEAGLDVDAGKYTTVCEDHNTTMAHGNLTLARYHLSDCLGWCEICRAEAEVVEEMMEK